MVSAHARQGKRLLVRKRLFEGGCERRGGAGLAESWCLSGHCSGRSDPWSPARAGAGVLYGRLGSQSSLLAWFLVRVCRWQEYFSCVCNCVEFRLFLLGCLGNGSCDYLPLFFKSSHAFTAVTYSGRRAPTFALPWEVYFSSLPQKYGEAGPVLEGSSESSRGALEVTSVAYSVTGTAPTSAKNNCCSF